NLMRKLMLKCVAAAGLLAGTTICASIYGRFQSDVDLDALLGMSAAAQAGGVYVNAIDLVIIPSEMAKYVEAIKENAANAVKEPGCREFNVLVMRKPTCSSRSRKRAANGRLSSFTARRTRARRWIRRRMARRAGIPMPCATI